MRLLATLTLRGGQTWIATDDGEQRVVEPLGTEKVEFEDRLTIAGNPFFPWRVIADVRISKSGAFANGETEAYRRLSGAYRVIQTFAPQLLEALECDTFDVFAQKMALLGLENFRSEHSAEVCAGMALPREVVE